MTGRIYLAGPITGASYHDARYGWRNDLAVRLKRGLNFSVQLLSPMRGTDDHAGAKSLPTPKPTEKNPVLTPKGTICRDIADIKKADLVVVCLVEAERTSIGTMMEMGIAKALGIPILLIDNGNPYHDHAWVREFADYHVNSLMAAVNVIRDHLSEGL